MKKPAPVQQQMRILRLLVAGAHLHAPVGLSNRYRLVLNGTTIGSAQHRTVIPMVEAGWIEGDVVTETFKLTPAGRDRTEVRAFVRHFAGQP